MYGLSGGSWLRISTAWATLTAESPMRSRSVEIFITATRKRRSIAVGCCSASTA
jgi:hypothetical protein